MVAPVAPSVAPQMEVAACERLIKAVTPNCPVPQPADVPEWDAIANSFASLSAAFTWGALFLAVIAIVAALGWGYLIRVWAEKEAKYEAQECAKREINRWLKEEAPQIIRKHVELLRNTSIGPNTDDDKAADEMGKEAG